jgi:hypothetical protein
MRHRRRIVGSAQSSAASSAINQDFLGRLTVLASDRSTRILDAKPRIPSLLWCSLIFGGFVLIMLTGFLRLASNRGHMILVSAVGVLPCLAAVPASSNSTANNEPIARKRRRAGET